MQSWLRLGLLSGLITFLLVRNMQVALMQAGILAAIYFFVLQERYTSTSYAPWVEDEEEEEEEEDDD